MAINSAASHLAWHETMELHELTAFQSNGLMDLKMCLPHVKDPQLHNLYSEVIQATETNLKELLPFYSLAPTGYRMGAEMDMTSFYAAHLLIFTKTTVRNYAIAITETATPALREVFKKQLNQAIDLHAKVFNYLYERGFYPAYDLQALLKGDVANAQKALSL